MERTNALKRAAGTAIEHPDAEEALHAIGREWGDYDIAQVDETFATRALEEFNMDIPVGSFICAKQDQTGLRVVKLDGETIVLV